MSFRILRDAAPVEGGGNPAAPPAPAPAAPQPPAAPAPPPAPPVVPLPADEVNRLYGVARQFESLQAQQAAAVEAERQKALVALAQKGEVETAFNTFKQEQETKLATLQTTLLNRERSLVVASALAGVPFASDAAAADARELLGLRVEAAFGPDGAPSVRDRATGRPAADVIREWLASPAAAHYLKPSTAGGAGATGGHTPPPNPATPTGEAAIVAQWKAARQAQGDGALWMQPRPGR
jgi:hypothetical protein